MAKLRKLQPNIHGGPTHLVGSLGNHTFDTILSRATVTLDLAVSCPCDFHGSQVKAGRQR